MLRSARFSQETLHPALAAGPPILFVLSLSLLLSDVFALPPPGALYPLLLVGAALVEIVVGSLLRRARATKLHRLREFVLLLAACYAVLALVQPGPLFARFAPDARLIIHVLGCALVWMLTLRFHAGFLAREDLLRTIGGKRGEPLRRDMRQTHGFATTIVLDMRGVRQSGGMLLGILVVLFMLVRIHGAPLSPTTVAASLACVVLYVLLAAIVNLFLEEFAHYSDGMPVAARYLRKRAVQLLAGTLLAGAVATLLASERAMLPLSLFREIGGWITALFSGAGPGPIPQPGASLPSPTPSEWFQASQQMEAVEPSQFWSSFFEILRLIFLGAVAAGGVAFLLAPFVTRRFRKSLKSLRPSDAVRRRFVRAVMAVWHLWRFLRIKLKRRRRPRYVAVEEAEAEQHRFRRGGPGNPLYWARKQAQRSTVLRDYRRVTQWCEDHGVGREPTQTVREHAERVAAKYPGLAEALRTVIRVVEQTVFSAEIVRRREKERYREAVQEILGRP
jgi:hypothetical protein